jgi:hypothetical protein
MNDDENKNTNDTIVKKNLNYNRIKKIVKKTKSLKKNLEDSNLKLVKLILSHFHYKIKRTAREMFDM